MGSSPRCCSRPWPVTTAQHLEFTKTPMTFSKALVAPGPGREEHTEASWSARSGPSGAPTRWPSRVSCTCARGLALGA